MATVPIAKIEEVLAKTNQPSWHWVIDGEDRIYADKDNPPTHDLSGHWEYSPTLEERYEADAPFYNSAINDYADNVPSKGYRIARRR